MSYPRGKAKSCTGLLILVGLASRHYGLTLAELMQEARASRSAVYRSLQALERMGVSIVRRQEPVRASWRMIYRLNGIRGMRFDIRRSC